jgi:hypothetical protein
VRAKSPSEVPKRSSDHSTSSSRWIQALPLSRQEQLSLRGAQARARLRRSHLCLLSSWNTHRSLPSSTGHDCFASALRETASTSTWSLPAWKRPDPRRRHRGVAPHLSPGSVLSLHPQHANLYCLIPSLSRRTIVLRSTRKCLIIYIFDKTFNPPAFKSVSMP